MTSNKHHVYVGKLKYHNRYVVNVPYVAWDLCRLSKLIHHGYLGGALRVNFVMHARMRKRSILFLKPSKHHNYKKKIMGFKEP